MVAQIRIMTADEFKEFVERPENDDRLFELINGELIEKVPTEMHGLLASLIAGELHAYRKRNPIGRVLVEVRYKLPDSDDNARIPDVSFISKERVQPVSYSGPVPLMPDLAVEIASPSDNPLTMREKALYYLTHGSKLVWLLFPRKKQIEVHTPERITTLEINDTLDGGDVLPGFTLPLKDLFED